MKLFISKIRQSKPAQKKTGFTLVEMIIYVTIFAVILTIIIQVFWQVNITGNRVQASAELQENVSQVINIAVRTVREGESLNTGASIFGSNPGVLVIDDTDTMLIDTYAKMISIAGQNISIRKLQLTRGFNAPVDITSDHVNVTNFKLTNMTPAGHPGVVQIELEVSRINPQNDPNFDGSFQVKTSAVIRKEL